MSGMQSFREMADSCLAMTGDLLARCRHRIAGTEQCRTAAGLVADRFRACCDSVVEEGFTIRPRALWWVGRVVAVAYAAAAVCWFIGGALTYAAAAACLLGCAYALSQYVFYGRLFDPLFPAAAGCNVSGALEPQGPVQRQVVLVGHHDSPFIFTFLERIPSVAFIPFLLGMLAFLFLSLCVFTAAILPLFSDARVVCGGALLWLTVAGLPFSASLFFMMSGTPSPGAGDNLNAVSMAAVLGEHFMRERGAGRGLERTRLVLLSTDGEEIGQRGAIRYVEAHRGQMAEVPTLVLNVDSVYSLADLAVLTRDRNCTCALSRPMVGDLCGIARERGIALKRIALPFGGGGTDAAAFAVAGIPAVSVIGQPVALVSKDPLYHTSRDTTSCIEPAAVAAVLELAVGYIRLVDGR